MQTELSSLRKENADLKSHLQQITTAVESLETENERLAAELRLVRQKLYGRTSERIPLVDPSVQPGLFNEAESPGEEETEEPTEEVGPYRRKKGGRRPLPADLPRVEVIHDLSDEEKQCECGCGERKRSGMEVSEELRVTPRRYEVIVHKRLTYGPWGRCNGANSDGEGSGMQTAPAPVKLLPKTIATASLLASVAVEKFADGMPLYRQAKRFERDGIDLSRGTLANWMVKAGERCLPLMDIFREDLRSGPLLNVDETPVQVLNEPGRANTTKSYMWVFRGGAGPPEGEVSPVVIFDYRPTRSGADILGEYLAGYGGCVQTDGYVGYEVLSELSVRHAGCWAHVRRKFVDVVRAVEKARKGKERRGSSADVALTKIRRLYEIEREGKSRGLRGEELLAYRRERAAPVVEEFHGWLTARVDSTPPRGLLGTAMGYTLKQWDRLVVYLDDPHVGLDNNAAENAIRPFAVGRKNWLFAGSPDGARASAALYSLVETAKANGLEPYRYLEHVFERLPHAVTPEDYHLLTPRGILHDATAETVTA